MGAERAASASYQQLIRGLSTDLDRGYRAWDSSATLRFMTGQLPDECDQLLQLQAGVITRAQALSAGMSRHALQAKLDSGHWRRLHSGVYAAFGARPDRAAVLWAAVLGG